MVEVEGLAHNEVCILHAERRHRLNGFAVCHSECVRCIEAEEVAAVCKDRAALLAVEVNCHFVREAVTRCGNLLGDRDFAGQTGLDALDKGHDVERGAEIILVGIGNLIGILAVGRLHLKGKTVVVAVSVDMHLLQIILKVGALRDLGREIHVDLADFGCRVVGLRREVILEYEFLKVFTAVVVIFLPGVCAAEHISGNRFRRAVRLYGNQVVICA